MNIKSYTELVELDTFEERFEYLKLNGIVGEDTYGYQRWINQRFYHSKDWLEFRDYIITRDMGCDLGVNGYDINGEAIIIHHLNPITKEDILERRFCVLDPNNAICTRLSTHNALHYGNYELLRINEFVERTPNDTCPWKR